MEGRSYVYTAENGEIPYISIPDLLKIRATDCPDQDAYICYTADMERYAITYSELYTQSLLFAKGLLTLGYERNSIVAIETKNNSEWLICSFGTQIAGLIPLHFAFSKPNGDDIVCLLNGVEKCCAIIVDQLSISICEHFIENMSKTTNTTEISSKIPTLKNVICTNSKDNAYCLYEDIMSKGTSSLVELPYISPDDICAIFLTSGSTGLSKAIPFSHRKIFHMGINWTKLLEVQPNEKFFTYFPFGWQASYPIATLTNKVTQVTLTEMRAIKTIGEMNELTLKVLAAEKCVSAVLLAPGICELIRDENAVCDAFPLRVIITAGLPVDSICAKIIGPKTNRFAVAYGCSEMGMVSTRTVDSSKNYESYSVGHPIPGTEIKIVDENGVLVPFGKSGDIYIRMRDRFLGYLNAKEKTKLCYDEHGWYKSDDVGYMNQDKCFVVTGRRSDMMIISNDLVSPSYLEGILKEHESVANAYIYAVHDEKTFQRAIAAVVLRKGKTGTESELKTFIKNQSGRYSESFLATRHVPSTFLFFDFFPVTHSGKLDRKRLTGLIKERLNLS